MTLSRRDFLKLMGGTAAALSFPSVLLQGFQKALAQAAERTAVIWLQAQSCSGCSVSLLNSIDPDIASVITQVISLNYHQTLMGGTGDVAIRVLEEAVEKQRKDFVLIVEGSVPTRSDWCCTIGEVNGRPVGAKEWVEKLGSQAKAIIAVGTCSAYGGICFIDMYDYPNASVSQIWPPNRIWWELERRLVLVYLGRSHASSEVHGKVIANFEQESADKSALEPLRRAARSGKDALYLGDFHAFGNAMIENTDAQRTLHPALVSSEAEAVIALAKEHGAIGWKVNGAGGAGGSVTILCNEESERKRAFIKAVPELNPAFQVLPIYLSRFGLRQWESTVVE